MTWKRNQKIKYKYDQHPENVSILNFTPTSVEEWNSYVDLKMKIKEHYAHVQDDKCAYCRQPIRYMGYGEPIEHIVPKSKKVKWMFHPYNLCLSCYGCNTKKGDNNTLSNEFNHYDDEFESYPESSQDYKIIHPHFDSYSKHIKEESFICKAKNGSYKGRNTIDICKLNRLDLLYSRARAKNKTRVLKRILIEFVINQQGTPEEMHEAQKMIDNIVRRYHYLRRLRENN